MMLRQDCVSLIIEVRKCSELDAKTDLLSEKLYTYLLLQTPFFNHGWMRSLTGDLTLLLQKMREDTIQYQLLR